MQLFFTPTVSDGHCILNKEESTHCVRVLRMKEGDEIFLTNGQGILYKAIILLADWKACQVQITETIEEYGKRNFYLHLAVAPTKNIARFEWFLEKAVEAGVDRITPLVCEHSERVVCNIERLNKVIVAAAKQSLKTYFPVLEEAMPFYNFMQQEFSGQKFIAYCEGEDRNHLWNAAQKQKDTLVIIGPEGDFSPKEIEEGKSKNFLTVSLGSSRLRTETAALAACFALNFLNES